MTNEEKELACSVASPLTCALGLRATKKEIPVSYLSQILKGRATHWDVTLGAAVGFGNPSVAFPDCGVGQEQPVGEGGRTLEPNWIEPLVEGGRC